jgi:hypothetical protein
VSAELVKHQAAPAASLPEKMQYAKALAASGMLPGQYRQQPANLLYALEYAESLGLHPMAAITGIHVIEGKPSASAALISALVRRAGHKLRVRGNDQEAVAQIIRADDPEFTYEVVWTLARAEQAGLARKDVWKKYPAAMLKARAITEVARDACEEALSGMHYTPEELGANVDADGEPVAAEVQQLRRVQPGEGDPWAAPAPQTGGSTVVDPESFKPYAPAQEIAEKAEKAESREALTILRDEAQAADVSADAGILAPDTEKPDTLREYLKRRWTELPKQDEKQGQPSEDDIPDVETVADGETEADAAERKLRTAAAKAGLTNLDEEFEKSYGLPIREAGAQQLRQMTAIITGSAA